jgi:DNA polymerase-3 subunit epsilon
MQLFTTKALRRRFLLVWCALFGSILSGVLITAAGLRAALAPAERATADNLLASTGDLPGLIAVGILAATGLLAAWITRTYFAPLVHAADQTHLICTTNPDARLDTSAPAEIRALGEAVNTLGVAFRQIAAQDARRIEEARTDLDRERNRLAALMSELAAGVVVCNAAGRILLYNERAHSLLTATESQSTSAATTAYMGLDRSLYALMNRESVEHALDRLSARMATGANDPGTSFMTATASGAILRARIAPVAETPPLRRDNASAPGFVLLLEDLSRDLSELEHRDRLLTELVEQARLALASARAATENLSSQSDMSVPMRQRFLAIAQQELLRLGGVVERVGSDHAARLHRRPDLEPMRVAELTAAIQRDVRALTGIAIDVQAVDAALWVRVDSYGVMQVIRYLARRLTRDGKARALALKTTPAGEYVHLDLVWTGAAIEAATVLEWETAPLSAAGESSESSVRELVARNRAQFWQEPARACAPAAFRIMLRGVGTELPAQHPVIRGRPIYYDFDLFRPSGESRTLDDLALNSLSYTAFDTETTGLEPSAGDEIISIGAVRIVNGRLLRADTFDQLIDPKRPIAPEAAKIHGIRQSMLAGQPDIAAVLPAFHRFCEDTVLLGHNVAFDMRFLQVKEAITGIRFAQPVLDTLLLSALVHSTLEDHRLEAIAHRMGVNVIARHTALGDAILTAEVFLRMLPLLAAKGIVTLRQAREAAQRTQHAKLRY